MYLFISYRVDREQNPQGAEVVLIKDDNTKLKLKRADEVFHRESNGVHFFENRIGDHKYTHKNILIPLPEKKL